MGRSIVAKEIENLKTKVIKSDKPITQLYDEANNSFNNKGLNFVVSLPPLSSVQHCLYDMRNKSLGVQKTVYRNFEEVQIPVSYCDFILADYYHEGIRILLFCSPDSRQLVGETREFFGDATFKSCPPPFAELYSIHADIGSTVETTNVVPLIFALLPNKKQKTYVTLYNLIKSELPSWSPDIFHCDFELAAINALTEVFPNIQLKGCFYHWSRAMWKKAKAMGFNKKKGHKRIIGLTAALPLLPEEEMEHGWEYVKAESQDLGMQKFINYIERFWLKKQIRKMLSVYGLRHRTNNAMEGWHSKINKRVTKGSITIPRLLNLLRQVQNTKIKQQQKNKGSKRTKIAIDNDDYIMNILLQFINGELSVGNTLEKLR